MMEKVYVLLSKDTKKILRDNKGTPIGFKSLPELLSDKAFTIGVMYEEDLNNLIYNENLNKDGLLDENNGL
jgi:hypothetical protein